MASENVMVDDVVGQRHNGEYRYGAVVQSFSEGEEESTLDPGCILVEWYPEGTGDDIHQSKVDVLDRALMPRDIVYKTKSHHEWGTVLDTNKTADLMIVGTDKKLKDIDADKLQYITRFIGGEVVSYGPWIGQLGGVRRMVYIKALTYKGCIGERLLAELSNIEDPHPHKSDKGGYEGLPHGSSIFYPGQTLLMPSKAAKFINWLPTGTETPTFPKNSQIKVLVKWVVMTSAKSKWIQASGISPTDEDQKKYLKELGMENRRKPPTNIKINQLKWLKGVNTFRNCCFSLGHRLTYTLTEEDAQELNKSVKKRKRKHKARKGHRSESVDRRQRRKSAASTSGIKRRFQQQRPNHRPDDESSSDEYEDLKEMQEKTIETANQEGDEEMTAAIVPVTDPDAGPQKLKSLAARKILLDAAAENEEKENAEDEKVDQEISSQTYTGQNDFIKIYGMHLTERKTMINLEAKKYVNEDGIDYNDEFKKLMAKLDINLDDVDQHSNDSYNVNRYFQRTSGRPMTLLLERGKKKKYGGDTFNKIPRPAHSEENADYERECVNVSFQAGNKIIYFAGQVVTVEIAMTSTSAKIQWQDATETENISSTELTPTETLNDNDFFPGDYVTDMRHLTDDLFRYGVIQKAFSKKRMAVVKWFTFKNTVLTTLDTEEVSIYDLQASNDFRYRVSDVVYLLGKVDGQISEFDHTQYTGQILRITTDGKLKINWSTGGTSYVYPHEVVLYNEEDGNAVSDDDSLFSSGDEEMDFDGSSSTEDDDMSWTTVTSDEEGGDEEEKSGAEDEADKEKDDNEAAVDKNKSDGEPMAVDGESEQTAKKEQQEGNDADTKDKEEEEKTKTEESEVKKEVEKPSLSLFEDVCNEIFAEEEDSKSQFQMLSAAPKSHKYYNYAHTAAADKRFVTAHRRDMRLFRKTPPKNIYIRAYEDRMDLMTAMIVGPDDTPFRDGLFMFEIYFPRNYPEVPPKVHFISLSPRLNPNLYENGTVCISLLGTWSGQGTENWTMNSSILQVLLSIQVLILNKEPYFNEAGYEPQRNTVAGLNSSRWYNEMVVRRMLQHVTLTVTSPPQPFADDDKQYRQLLREFLPRFLARNRALLRASKEAARSAPSSDGDKAAGSDGLDVDLSELAGFPLLCLSQGVIVGMKDKLDYLEKEARKRNLLS